MHGDCAFDLVDSGTLAQASQDITTLSSWRQCMNPTVCKSSDPCIVCGKVNKNVELNSKKPRLVATFCQEHAYDLFPERKQAKARHTE